MLIVSNFSNHVWKKKNHVSFIKKVYISIAGLLKTGLPRGKIESIFKPFTNFDIRKNELFRKLIFRNNSFENTQCVNPTHDVTKINWL